MSKIHYIPSNRVGPGFCVAGCWIGVRKLELYKHIRFTTNKNNTTCKNCLKRIAENHPNTLM